MVVRMNNRHMLRGATGLGIAAAVLLSIPGAAQSQNKDTKFLGQTLTKSAPTYLVLTDVNVRKAPLTKSPRVGRFRKGVRIDAAGKAKGTNWVAVRKDGKEMGFIYATALAAVLDGSLAQPVKGKLSGSGQPDCDYVIRYEGRSKVEGDVQVISDYFAEFTCKQDGKPISFSATMFLTELPYRSLKTEVYQINVDLPKVSNDDEEVMSVTSLYDHTKSEVSFEAVSIASMAKGQPKSKKKADAIPAVLTSAVEFAHQVWGPRVWKTLAEAK